MTKTSHKKNRPFDFKLIDLVQPHPVLYMRQMPGMSTFVVMKTKDKVWRQIAAEMGCSVQFCINRWNNLRGQFQKELKHSNSLCPKSGVIRESTWPYLERMRFLECTVQANKPKKLKLSKRKLKELEEIEQAIDWKAEDGNVSTGSEEVDVEHYEYDEVGNSNVIQEGYVGDEEYNVIEEIAEEVVGTEQAEETIEYGTNSTLENYSKIHTLLTGFEQETLKCIERRLMAFLCKCQLRALSDQSIDDLFV